MSTAILALSVALALVIAAVAIWYDTQNVREKTQMPEGEIIFADTDQRHSLDEMLTAPDIGLVGKPDYLVQSADGNLIPVEVKSGKAPPEPYESHIMQLMAYCFLVEENYGIRPPYGIVQYRDQAYEIAYSDEMEAAVLEIVAEMHNALLDDDVGISHDEPLRCAACGVRDYCNQRIDQ